MRTLGAMLKRCEKLYLCHIFIMVKWRHLPPVIWFSRNGDQSHWSITLRYFWTFSDTSGCVVNILTPRWAYIYDYQKGSTVAKPNPPIDAHRTFEASNACSLLWPASESGPLGFSLFDSQHEALLVSTTWLACTMLVVISITLVSFQAQCFNKRAMNDPRSESKHHYF